MISVEYSGSKNFASDTSSLRSSMTRNNVDNTTRTIPGSAAILNNAVKFPVDNGGDNPWASLDRYGRRRRRRRLPFWTPDDLDDDGQENHGCPDTTQAVDDEVPDASVEYRETVPSASLTSVRAVVEDFDDSSTEQSSVGRRRVTTLPHDTERTLAGSVSFQQDDATKSARTNATSAALTLSWESCPFPDTGVGSALAARANSEGNVLSGVESTETGRSSRLLSCASAMLGRFVTQTRQRLATVSAADWRRRCDVVSKHQYSSSTSFHDERGRLSEQSGTHTVATTPAEKDEHDGVSITPREVRLLSLSGSVDSNTGRRRSQRHVTNAPTMSSTVARPTGCDTATLDVSALATETDVKLDHEALQRTRSSKKRPTLRRYPSVERLDLPRRRESVATAILAGGDRKRAERFRRQYVDVKLQRQATPLELPTQTMKSMPTVVDVCGTTRHDVTACPQLLRVPASANVTLS